MPQKPRLLFTFTVLCFATTLSPAHALGQDATAWRITTKGFGTVKVGMTADQASAALGVRLVLGESFDDHGQCRFATPARNFAGVSFMMISGRIARVDVDSDAYATPSGATVGMTVQQVKAMYPGRIQVSPHAYSDGHYLTYMPKDATDRNYRIVFETDGKRVTSIRAGRLPEVEYVEGCA
jgi:hypothetical protein